MMLEKKRGYPHLCLDEFGSFEQQTLKLFEHQEIAVRNIDGGDADTFFTAIRAKLAADHRLTKISSHYIY